MADINEARLEYNRLRDSLRKRYKTLEKHGLMHPEMPIPWTKIPKGQEKEYLKDYKKRLLTPKTSYREIRHKQKELNTHIIKQLRNRGIKTIKTEKDLEKYGKFMNNLRNKFFEIYKLESDKPMELYNILKEKKVSPKRIEKMLEKMAKNEDNIQNKVDHVTQYLKDNKDTMNRNDLIKYLNDL